MNRGKDKQKVGGKKSINPFKKPGKSRKENRER